MFLARRADGRYDLRIGAVERRLLTDVCGELRTMLVARADDDPALHRLFPPAYPDDAERNAFYQQMARDELRDSRIHALDTVIETAAAQELTEEQLAQWMTAVNSVRLALGTRLDITEDRDEGPIAEDDPDFPAYVAYDYLSMLLDLVVRAMSDS